MRLRITRMPVYLCVLELRKNWSDAIFLDIRCCHKDQFILGVCFENLTHNFTPR